MVNFHFLVVVVSSNGPRTSCPSERFLAAQIIGAKDTCELSTMKIAQSTALIKVIVNTGQHDLSRENVCADFIPGNFLISRVRREASQPQTSTKVSALGPSPSLFNY